MAEKKFYIRVPGEKVEVTEEIYLTYYRSRRRDRAQRERDKYNGLVFYNSLDTDDTLGEEVISDSDVPSVEDLAVNNILQEKLNHCLAMLSETERELINALYFEGLTERQFAKQTGKHYMTIHNRKVRVLLKLKKMIDK